MGKFYLKTVCPPGNSLVKSVENKASTASDKYDDVDKSVVF